MKTFVVGSGTWGTALANVLADNGYEVRIYGRSPEQVRDINENHRNSRYFDEVEFNPALTATNDLSEVRDYDIILLAVPSSSAKGVLKQLNEYIDRPIILINVSKGFDPDTFERLSISLSRCIDPENLKGYAALLGPSHAEEVIRRMYTTVNIVCEDEEIARSLQKMFANEYFRVYRNDDMIGAEYGTGLKNVIAIASGILYGLGLGDNAKASLMTRGLAEMTRFGLMMGGRLETFMGLCGMGDLIVTCTSPHSRNWQAGYQIGRDNSVDNFFRNNRSTVEGIAACRIIHAQAEQLGISMPITNELYNVLFEGGKPSEAISRLMTRELKAE